MCLIVKCCNPKFPGGCFKYIYTSLAEWAVCFGVIAAAGLAFFFVAENLQIFSDNPPAIICSITVARAINL